MLGEEREYEIVGYHGTTSSAQESIENHGLDPNLVEKRDDHWLGQGVYFYDDFDLAKWWAETKANKKERHESALVYKADIRCLKKHVLNLDDRKDLEMFLQACLEFSEDLQETYMKLPAFKAQKFKAIFYDYYKEEHDIYVMIRTFPKPAPRYAETIRTGETLKKQKKLFEILGLSFYETQICVSKAECIKDLSKVYDKAELYDETEEVL